MAAMEECSPTAERAEKISVEKETDSGVDNSSESGRSCDDDRNTVFSSTDSLDYDPPVVRKCDLLISVQSFLDNERNARFNVEDLPPSCPHRAKFSENKDDATIAVLEVEQPSMLEPNNNEEPDINVDHLPPYFQSLKEGTKVSASFDVSQDTKPPWLDEDKFKRGQKFARDNFFCINFAEMVSLFLIFSVKTALAPLIFTGKSSSPFTAYKRYLSTCERLISWYSSDPWSKDSESYKNMKVVKMLHKNVQAKLTAAPNEDISRCCTVGEDKAWATSRPLLIDDFRSSCPVPQVAINPSLNGRLWLNQADMAATQFAFVGLAITFPKEFGMHYATDEDLDAFVYMWRCLGYLHGIQDKYNFCCDGLQEVQQRTRDFINHMLKPSLRDVDSDWEHMSRCLVEGINFYVPAVTFEASLKYLCSILNIHVPRLTKSLTLWQTFLFRVTQFIFAVVLRIPGMIALNNIMIRKQIRAAKNASPATLEKWEKTQFPYMKENKVAVGVV